MTVNELSCTEKDHFKPSYNVISIGLSGLLQNDPSCILKLVYIEIRDPKSKIRPILNLQLIWIPLNGEHRPTNE